MRGLDVLMEVVDILVDRHDRLMKLRMLVLRHTFTIRFDDIVVNSSYDKEIHDDECDDCQCQVEESSRRRRLFPTARGYLGFKKGFELNLTFELI